MRRLWIRHRDVTPEGPQEPPGEAPLALLVPTWALIVVNFYFGIDATLTAGVAGTAAQSLLGVLP